MQSNLIKKKKEIMMKTLFEAIIGFTVVFGPAITIWLLN